MDARTSGLIAGTNGWHLSRSEEVTEFECDDKPVSETALVKASTSAVTTAAYGGGSVCLGFRVQGLWFQGCSVYGFRVQGSGFRVRGCRMSRPEVESEVPKAIGGLGQHREGPLLFQATFTD